MSRLKCSVCTFGCNDQESWMNHLLSDDHRASQLVHLLWNWPLHKNQRALVIESPSQGDDDEEIHVKLHLRSFDEFLKQLFHLSIHPGNIQDFYVDYKWNLAVLLLKTSGEAMALWEKAMTTPFFESFQITLKSMHFLDRDKFESLEKIRLGQPGTEENPEDSYLADINRAFETIRRSPMNLNQQLLYLLECYTVTMSDIDLQQVVFDDLKSIFAQKFVQSNLILVEGAGCHFGYKFRPINIHAFMDLALNGYETISDLRQAVSKILVQSKSFLLVKDLTWRKNNPDFTLLQFRHTSLNILIALRICAKKEDNNEHLWDQTLMAYLVSFDKRAVALTNFILLWNNQHKIGVPVLVIITLVLVFLMKKGVIPSVRLLQDLQPWEKRDVRDGWDFSLCFDEKLIQEHFDGIVEIVPTHNDSPYDAKDVLLWTREMFVWLTERSLEDSVVSILAADIIPREYFLPRGLSKMPEGLMKKYLISPDGIVRSSENQKLDVDSRIPVIIQNPFILSKNIAQMKRGRVRRFQKQCHDSLTKIDKALKEANLLLVFTEDLETEALTPAVKCDQRSEVSKDFHSPESSPQKPPVNREVFLAESNNNASELTFIDVNSRNIKTIPPEKLSEENQNINTTVSQPRIQIRTDLCTPPVSPNPANLNDLDDNNDFLPLPSSPRISCSGDSNKTQSQIRKPPVPSKRTWADSDDSYFQNGRSKRSGKNIDNSVNSQLLISLNQNWIPSIRNRHEKTMLPITPIPKNLMQCGDLVERKWLQKRRLTSSKTFEDSCAKRNGSSFKNRFIIPKHSIYNEEKHKSTKETQARLKKLINHVEINLEKRCSPKKIPQKFSEACDTTFSDQSNIQVHSTLSKHEKAVDSKAQPARVVNHLNVPDSGSFEDKSWFDISAPNFMDIILEATEKYRSKNEEADKMKAKNLWLSFMEDLFTEVWSFSFGIEAGIAVKKETKDKKKDPKEASGDEPIWLQKWKKLSQSEEKFHRKWKMKAVTCFWTNREELTNMVKSIEGYDEMDPLIFEKSVTELCTHARLIQHTSVAIPNSTTGASLDTLPIQSIPEFWCEVTLCTSRKKDTMNRHKNHYYYFAFRTPNPSSVQTQQAINCLKRVLRGLIPRYAKRRLQNWLQTSI